MNDTCVDFTNELCWITILLLLLLIFILYLGAVLLSRKKWIILLSLLLHARRENLVIIHWYLLLWLPVQKTCRCRGWFPCSRIFPQSIVILKPVVISSIVHLLLCLFHDYTIEVVIELTILVVVLGVCRGDAIIARQYLVIVCDTAAASHANKIVNLQSGQWQE